MRIIFKALIFIPLFLFISSTCFAGDFWPMQVGSWYEFDSYDSAEPQNEWTWRAEVVGTATYGSYDYFVMGSWNAKNNGSYHERPFRTTDTALYRYVGTDMMQWQQADVGTTWISRYWDTSEEVTEIIGIESVTVPYGTFDNAYVHRTYVNWDDPDKPDSPYWDEYLVPGVGMVKRVDHHEDPDDNPPIYQELAAVGIVPEPVSSTLFLIGGASLGFRHIRKKRKNIC